jgi:hypothetical protein
MRLREDRGRPWAVVLIVAAFAGVHSLLAARGVKAAVERVVGERGRNGLYRPLYVAQSLVMTVLGVRLFLRLPDRTLYVVPAPYAWGCRVVQAGAAGLLLSALEATGISRIVGWPQLVQLARGEMPVREQEAQGPGMTRWGDEMEARGRLGSFGIRRICR